LGFRLAKSRSLEAIDPLSGRQAGGDELMGVLLRQLITRSAAQLAVLAALLFVSAGTLEWWRAWVLVGMLCLGTVASLLDLYPDHKELLRERLKSPLQKDQRLADKMVLMPFLVLFLGLFVLIPLDLFRWHLLPQAPPFLSWLGLALLLVGWCMAHLSLKHNPYAVLVVKDQAARSQTVVDTGVYGFVRHPMYSGAIAFMLGIPLWLESYAGTLLVIVMILLLALRIVFEERFLRGRLAGYEAYARKVRYRLIPWIW
jgi:protein-S-isoprenylcysteine O-methyltransferase Ste14